MADYTVKVEGVNSGGGGSVPPQTPSNPSEQPVTPDVQPKARDYMPDTNRLTEEYRKLLQQQGGVVIPGSANARQLWSQVEANARQEVTGSVQEKYNQRRLEVAEGRKQKEDELYAKQDSRREDLDLWRDRQRDIILDDWRKKGKNPEDPNNPIEKSAEWRAIDKEYDETTKLYDAQNKREWREFEAEGKAEDKQVDKEEKDELAAALRELTATLKDSKEAAERDDERGDSEDSYLGRLRAERRQILSERDSAATREEALAANERLAAKDEEIRRVTSGGEQGKPMFDRYMMGVQGIQGIYSGLESGDLGGAVMGVGSTISGFGGLSLKSAMRVAGIAALVAGAIKSVHGSNERYNATADLAAYRSTSGGRSGTDALMGTVNALYNAGINRSAANPNGVQYEDFGLDYKEFSQRAANTVQQRGTGEGWYTETMKQIGLERQFGLRQNSLEQGSQFDRYGQTVTDAVTTLVNALSAYEVEGANKRDFSRVQEKYDFQQSIMQSYMGRSDKPNYDVANQAVMSMNLVKGITHDQRDVSDYASFQNAIQNPKNDRMRALLFSTVQEMMPEMKDSHGNFYDATDAGRMDLIDRAIRNPENEGKIMQAMIQKISEMYGGINTQMGYFAFKNLFPDIAPDRLDQYVEQFSTGSLASVNLREAPKDSMIGIERGYASADAEQYAAQSKEYTNGMTRMVGDIKKILTDFMDVLTLNANLFDPAAVRAAQGN